MKCYRLKHIPTGLYLCPSREIKVKGYDGYSSYVKSNLSKKGKVYTKTPNVDWYGRGIYSHLKEHVYIDNRGIPKNTTIPISKDLVEIEEL